MKKFTTFKKLKDYLKINNLKVKTIKWEVYTLLNDEKIIFITK